VTQRGSDVGTSHPCDMMFSGVRRLRRARFTIIWSGRQPGMFIPHGYFTCPLLCGLSPWYITGSWLIPFAPCGHSAVRTGNVRVALRLSSEIYFRIIRSRSLASYEPVLSLSLSLSLSPSFSFSSFFFFNFERLARFMWQLILFTEIPAHYECKSVWYIM